MSWAAGAEVSPVGREAGGLCGPGGAAAATAAAFKLGRFRRARGVSGAALREPRDSGRRPFEAELFCPLSCRGSRKRATASLTATPPFFLFNILFLGTSAVIKSSPG